MKGTAPDPRNDAGQTALMAATFSGHQPIVQLLLDHGADVNATDPEGRTPLMFAISWGGNDMVQLLIDRGADLFIKDQQGWDAYRLARDRGYRDLMDLLLKAMYPPDSTEKESQGSY